MEQIAIIGVKGVNCQLLKYQISDICTVRHIHMSTTGHDDGKEHFYLKIQYSSDYHGDGNIFYSRVGVVSTTT